MKTEKKIDIVGRHKVELYYLGPPEQIIGVNWGFRFNKFSMESWWFKLIMDAVQIDYGRGSILK